MKQENSPPLGPIGIWTWTLDGSPWQQVIRHAQLIESLGYSALWFKEDFGRDGLVAAALLLEATQSLVIANGVASMLARDPASMRSAQRCLAEAHPGRHVLGVGVSHKPHAAARGLEYVAPRQRASEYLQTMKSTEFISPDPKSQTTTLLAALGPRMLETARELADGVHTFGAMPEHTHRARQVLGEEKWLAPVQPVVLETDPARGLDIALAYTELLFGIENYRRNWARLGFDRVDARLASSLVAIGTEEKGVERVHEHFDAGADHVAVQILSADLQAVPVDGWTRFAPAVAELASKYTTIKEKIR